MTSGLANALLGSWLLLAAGEAPASELDSLLASLARVPPQSIAFVESHASPLLEQELIVEGSLEYLGPGKLSRIVAKPYRERTDIDGGEVRILREGRPERRFSLRHHPELGGMLAAFSALLAGDRQSLERSFESSLVLNPGGWQLDLVPRKSGRRNHIGRIRVRGTGSEPACITVVTGEGKTASEVLLGAAASNPDVVRQRSEQCGVRS